MSHGIQRADKNAVGLDINNEYILRILSDFLHKKKSECIDRLSWNDIITTVQRHQLLPIIYYQCKEFIPEEYLNRCQDAYFQQIQRFTLMNRSIGRFKTLLSKVELCFFKGSIIKNYYPVPALRTMGDIDVLIRPDAFLEVEKMLFDFGAIPGEEKNSYIFDGFTFEIHDSLIHEHSEHEKYKLYFDDIWSFISDDEMDWNKHFIYLIIHLKNHLVGDGVGLRQFMDIAVIMEKESLNWNFIKSELSKLGLVDFLNRVLAMIDYCFNISITAENESLIPESDLHTMVGKVVEYGVFGFQNNNQIAVLMSNSKSKSKVMTRIAFVMRTLFPNYRYMCSVGYCNYVKYSIILLPVAWMHRLVRQLHMKDARSAASNKVFVPNSKINDKLEEYRIWGLY